MKFGMPLWLAILPLVAIGLVGLWIWSHARARATLRAAFQTPLLPALLRSFDPRRRWLRQALFGLAALALVFALARPQWGRKEIELERTGVDLVIALDVSRSMLTADAGNTNRLTAATRAIQHLIDRLGGDRVALVWFAGEAALAAPLTRDHVAVERALLAAGPDALSQAGSNLGTAIQRARESFDRAHEGPQALLVVSDGEQLQGDAAAAARAALQAGIHVHTAGVGSAAGGPIPQRASGPLRAVRNAAGREGVSRRDEQQLQGIAAAGGGLYTRLEGADSEALIGWFENASASLARTTEKRMTNEPQERFQWPLTAVLVLLAVEWMIGERRAHTRKPA